ncbi:TonB-dependent receptor [bacterium]|nr:TonB-dependent receptor [bacterium]
MKRWHLLIILIAATGIAAQSSHTITGRVSDALTNIPLAGAHVTIRGSGLGTVTDATGRFCFENLLQGTYSITVTYMGYAPREEDIRVSTGRTADLVFRLHPVTVELAGVTVTGFSGEASPLPGTLILSQKDIRTGGASTLPDLLKSIPGLDIDPESRTGSSRLSIRGSQANQVLVLVDGAPLNNHRDGSADLSLVPLELIDTITIKKGGGSSLYGSGAIGGVIDIKTITPDSGRVQVRVQSGTFGSLLVSPRLTVRTGNLTFLTALTRHVDRNRYPFSYTAPGDTLLNEIRRNADISLTNWFFKSGFRSGRHEAVLQGGIECSDRGLPGQVFTWTPSARVMTTRKQMRAQYRIGFSRSLLSLSLQAGVTRIHNTNIYPPDTELRDRRYPEYNYRDRIGSLRTETVFRAPIAPWLSGRASWEMGMISFSDRDLLDDSSPVGNARDLSQSLSLMQTAACSIPAVSVRAILSPSLRYDGITSRAGARVRRESMVSPGISGRINWQGPLQLYTGFDRSGNFRAPTFADLFYQDARIQGKPDLLPEKSIHTQASFGLVCHAAGIARLECTVFRDRIQDLISWRLGSFEVFRPYNTDARITGSEWLAEWESVSGSLHARTALTILDPRNKSGNRITDNTILPYRPLRSFKASLSWHTRLGEIVCTYARTGRRALNEANTSWSDPFSTIDLTLSRTLVFSYFTAVLSCEAHNLLDTRYEIIERMVLPGRRLFISIDITPNLNIR